MEWIQALLPLGAIGLLLLLGFLGMKIENAKKERIKLKRRKLVVDDALRKYDEGEFAKEILSYYAEGLGGRYSVFEEENEHRRYYH